jgi:hypothetical protein
VTPSGAVFPTTPSDPLCRIDLSVRGSARVGVLVTVLLAAPMDVRAGLAGVWGRGAVASDPALRWYRR